jgi:hypothetical protein
LGISPLSRNGPRGAWRKSSNQCLRSQLYSQAWSKPRVGLLPEQEVCSTPTAASLAGPSVGKSHLFLFRRKESVSRVLVFNNPLPHDQIPARIMKMIDLIVLKGSGFCFEAERCRKQRCQIRSVSSVDMPNWDCFEKLLVQSSLPTPDS